MVIAGWQLKGGQVEDRELLFCLEWPKTDVLCIIMCSIFCCLCAGKMKGLAFIKDPDGYWIEILNPNTKL